MAFLLCWKMGFLDKLKEKLDHHGGHNAGNVPPGPAVDEGSLPQFVPPNRPVEPLSADGPPSARDVYRHRQHVGVNLGAWMVGERWISDGLYAAAPSADAQKSELSAVSAAVIGHGHEAARHAWESHWDSWLDHDQDLSDLAHAGVNAVRIPLGYFSLSRPEILAGTPFENLAYVYAGCWSRIEAFCASCDRHGLGVLLDLHCVPGGVNPDAHSGTDSCRADFYSNTHFQHLALRCVEFLCGQASRMPNVVGVQVCNEPAWGKNADTTPYYLSCLETARRYGNVPIYIGDSWDPAAACAAIGNHVSCNPDDFPVVDHHYYYCFDDRYKAATSAQIADEVSHAPEWAECAKAAGDGNVVVGEWALTLSGDSLSRPANGDVKAARRQFGHAQLDAFTAIKNLPLAPSPRGGGGGERVCEAGRGGCFFWTYKFQVRNYDNSWDLRDMIHQGILPSYLRARVDVGAPQLHAYDQIVSDATSAHAGYWDAPENGGGQGMEHWRFDEGFRTGWADAVAFAQQGESVVGFRGQWNRRRTAAHIRARGESAAVWEFGAGLEAGIDAFNRIAVTRPQLDIS